MAAIVRTNAREFALKVRYFGDKTVPEATRLLRNKIGLQLLSLITLKTPVDTGRARANWIVSLNEENLRELFDTDKSGASTIAKGTATINQFEQPFGAIWLQNNVIYILSLEHGHSKQAPNGMVLRSIQEVMSQFRARR